MSDNDESLEALAAALAAERARAEGLRSGYHERGRRITELEAELGELRRLLVRVRDEVSTAVRYVRVAANSADSGANGLDVALQLIDARSGGTQA